MYYIKQTVYYYVCWLEFGSGSTGIVISFPDSACYWPPGLWPPCCRVTVTDELCSCRYVEEPGPRGVCRLPVNEATSMSSSDSCCSVDCLCVRLVRLLKALCLAPETVA